MLTTTFAVLGVAALVFGLAAITVSLIGVLRLPTLDLKLHALAIATGVGVAAVLVAAVGTGNSEVIMRAALVAVFMAITAPLSSHAISRAAHHRRRDERSGGPTGSPDAGP